MLRRSKPRRPTVSSISSTLGRMVSSGSFFSRRPKATFSYTFRCGNSAYFWNTVFTCRLYGGTEAISLPSKKTLPDFGVINPAITRKVVVLPQPEGPRNVTNSLSWMSRESSSRILSPSKSTTMSFSDTISFILLHPPLRNLVPPRASLMPARRLFPVGQRQLCRPAKGLLHHRKRGSCSSTYNANVF